MGNLSLDFFGLFVLPGSEFMWGLIFGIVPEILVGVLLWNKFLAGRIRKGQLRDVDAGKWDSAIERIGTPVREEMAAMKTDLEAKVAEVQEEVRAFYGHFDDFREKLPKVMHAVVIGASGLEKRETQALMAAKGAEFEEGLEFAEAQLKMEPERLLARAIHKVEEWEPSPAWKEAHPMLQLASEVGKPLVVQGLRDALEDRQGGLPSKGRTSGKPNPYG